MPDEYGHATPQEAEDAVKQLREALQNYINVVSCEPLMLDIALVTYEVVKFEEDTGDPMRTVNWLCPTDNFSPSGILGLAETGRALARSEILNTMFSEEED